MSPGRAVLAILCFDPALEQVGALHQALCVPAKGMHAVWRLRTPDNEVFGQNDRNIYEHPRTHSTCLYHSIFFTRFQTKKGPRAARIFHVRTG